MLKEKIMKWKVQIIIGLVILLALIGGLSFYMTIDAGEQKFEGEWAFKSGDPGCSPSVKFIGENTMTIYSSRGMELTGTIKKLENDSYSFDAKRGIIVIELKKLENGLLYLKDGNRNCNYQKQ